MKEKKAPIQKDEKNVTIQEKMKKEAIEWAGAIVWALAVFFLLFQPFVMSGYKIPSGSMEDTLLIGDYIQIDKCTFGGKIPFTHIRVPGYRKPVQGDIVAFWSLEDPTMRLIKRCVAVGGQTVEVRNNQLFVDGKAVDGDYIRHKDSYVIPQGDANDIRDNFGPVVVPDGMYFMMGDNRDNSHDSRFFGPVPFEQVIGLARFIYFSRDEQSGNSFFTTIRFSRIFKPISTDKGREPFRNGKQP